MSKPKGTSFAAYYNNASTKLNHQIKCGVVFPIKGNSPHIDVYNVIIVQPRIENH